MYVTNLLDEISNDEASSFERAYGGEDGGCEHHLVTYVSRKKTPSNQKLSKEACECVRVIITKYHGNRDSTKVTESMIWHSMAVVFQSLSGTDVTDAKPHSRPSCYKVVHLVG